MITISFLQFDFIKNLKSSYVGQEAISKRGILILKNPVENCIVTNWDDMEVLWTHMFENELSVPSEKHPILMTEPPLNPKANREKMVQIMFEVFKTPALYVANTPALSLLATGSRTGLSVIAGHGAAYVTPVYEGAIIPHAIPKLEISGKDLDYYMMKLLYESERHNFAHADALPLSRDIKEHLCYVAMDFEQEMQKPECDIETTFEDPCGGLIKIGNERFRCPEAMFNPEDHLGYGYYGIHQAVCFSIMKCDADIRKDLFSNIVISGGLTLFPGLQERLEAEVAKLAPPDTEVNVVADPDRKLAAWRGGSILASSPQFQEMLIHKDEYEEFGPSIVQRKCF